MSIAKVKWSDADEFKFDEDKLAEIEAKAEEDRSSRTSQDATDDENSEDPINNRYANWSSFSHQIIPSILMLEILSLFRN